MPLCACRTGAFFPQLRHSLCRAVQALCVASTSRAWLKCARRAGVCTALSPNSHLPRHKGAPSATACKTRSRASEARSAASCSLSAVHNCGYIPHNRHYAQRGAEAHSSRAQPALLLLTTESCIEACAPALLSCSFVCYNATRWLELSRCYFDAHCADAGNFPSRRATFRAGIGLWQWSSMTSASCVNCRTLSTGTQMLPCNVPTSPPKCWMSCPKLIKLCH